MEENRIPEEETPVSRPRWQVWLAGIAALVVFVGFLLYCWQIAHGGM